MRRLHTRISRVLAVAALPLAGLGCAGGISDGTDHQMGAGGTTAMPGAMPGPGQMPGGMTTPPAGTPGATPAPVACAPGSVGWTPMRRLTREQYANTVRDLLGGARVATDAIADDETVGAFHTNLVGTATDLTAQQYMEAAENLARQAAGKLDMLIACDHAAMGDAGCADVFIERFGLRAFRRPLAPDEKARFKATYTTFAANGGYANGIRVVIQNMLQSPNFLYLVEGGVPAQAKDGVVPLSPYELATRLSYLLWATTPDDALLQAAQTGGLGDAKGLRAQVDRMLKDNRAKDALTSFHMQWLGLSSFSSVFKDAMVYPAFTPALQAAMRNETTGFIDQVIRRGDARLSTLLTAAFTPSTDPMLLAFYGATRPATAAATDPTPLDPTQRSGLLTQGAFLAMHASGNQGSPVQRGVVVLRNLLCVDLPDPPPNVNNNPPSPKATATTRERFADHEKDASCAGCHRLIDGIGLGFESYDGIGKYRTVENGKPIDARGEVLVGGDAIKGTFNGAIDLARKLAASPEAQQCYARQWLRYALGRPESDAEACALQNIQAAFASSKLDVRELIAAIVTSDAFRMRRMANDVGGKAP